MMEDYLEHKKREAALQMLFALELGDAQQPEELASLLKKQLKLGKPVVDEVAVFVARVWEKKSTLDQWIIKQSVSFDFHRVTPLEKSILRLALYEAVWDKLEMSIVLSEAIRLSKKFSSEKAYTYLHGMIDQTYASIKEHPLCC